MRDAGPGCRESGPRQWGHLRSVHSRRENRLRPTRAQARRTRLKKGDGVLTVGNSPACNDGASALVVMAEDEAARLGLIPMARIVGYAGAALAPEWFTIAPIEAIKRVLTKTGLTIGDIDLFEINEAFSAVSLAINRELGLDEKKVNVNGGAVALGHPIGATGARLLTTLVHAMAARGARRGLAGLCIGGGEALAMIVER